MLPWIRLLILSKLYVECQHTHKGHSFRFIFLGYLLLVYEGPCLSHCWAHNFAQVDAELFKL